MSEALVAVVHFELKLGPRGSIGGFHEIRGLASETEVIEHAAVDEHGRPFIQTVPGALRWPAIVLRRRLDGSPALWEWREEVLECGVEAARLNGTIILLDALGQPAVTHAFLGGWPARYAITDLDTAAEAGAQEEIVICHEGLRRL